MKNYNHYIERNPALVMGKPIIKGTRLSVEHIIEVLLPRQQPFNVRRSEAADDPVLDAIPRYIKKVAREP